MAEIILHREPVTKHGSHNQASHGRGKGGAGGGAGGSRSNLTPEQNAQVDSLAIEMYNHKQSMPLSMKLGRTNTPAARAHIAAGQDIVSRATAILGGSRAAAMGELNSRMGI